MSSLPTERYCRRGRQCKLYDPNTGRSQKLGRYHQGDLCRQCEQDTDLPEDTPGEHRDLSHAARVVFEEGIVDEYKIVPTLAFAARAAQNPLLARVRDKFLAVAVGSEDWEDLRQGFLNAFITLDVETVVDGVLVVRHEPFWVGYVPWDEEAPVREIVIDVYFRPSRAEDVGDRYERALRSASIPYERWDRGLVSYKAYPDSLRIKVCPLDRSMDLHDEMLIWPQHEQLSFPPPIVVQNTYSALDQSFRHLVLEGRKGGGGFRQETLVPGVCAWYVGDCGKLNEDTSLRDKVVRVLDKHLLGPLGREPLETKSSDRARKLWQRVREQSKLIQRMDDELLTRHSKLHEFF